jgi:hypothetical protein
MRALHHTPEYGSRRPRLSWRSSAAAVGLAIGVAVGPVVQPAVAQQANPTATPVTVSLQIAQPAAPTPTPQPVVFTNTNQQSLVNGSVPTPVSVASALATPTTGALQLTGCSDQLFVDCTINKSNSPTAEGTLQAWAIQSALQLYKLPPSDAPLLMSNARDSVRGLLLSRLLTASQKPPSEQTPEEAAMLATISDKVKQFHIAVAEDAEALYQSWQVNPFCFQPPQTALAAGGWNGDPTPTPQEQMFQPAPPSYDQFKAWGTAMEMAKLGDNDTTIGDMGLKMKVLAGMGIGYAPAVALAWRAGYNMPESWYRASAPFRFQKFFDLVKQGRAAEFGGNSASTANSGGTSGSSGASAEEVGTQDALQTVTNETSQAATDASVAAQGDAAGGEVITDITASSVDAGLATAEVAETTATTSTVAVAGVSGAILVASSVGIILVCLAALIEGSIDLATRENLPKNLNDAIASAQNSTPDLAGADNALTQEIFASMTAQEALPASVNPGPPPSASDLQINPDPASPLSIHYLSPDGSYHTARAPQKGWWVDTDASGKSQLKLSIDFLDPYQTSWDASRAGSSILLSKDLDANQADLVATTTFQYVDKDASGNLVPREARLAANPTETWSITGTAANIGGDSIAHFNSATGQWTSVDGGAIKVAVGPNGQPWLVNRQGAIFNRTRGQTGYIDGAWQVVPGSATDIAIGADGSVWAIGTQTANIGGNMILHYHPSPC